MDYRAVKKAIPGLGTLFGSGKKSEKIVSDALTRLSKDEDVMRLINTAGWKSLSAEYREMINQLREYAWWLCNDVTEHEKEIQQTKNLANAADIFINMAEDKINEQENIRKELEKNQGTDRD